MPKEDWGFLNEKAFETALQASVPERLPDKVAAAVTPWKRAMGRVLAGTALTGTNLWGLNYPLPGIGLVLMLLGFRLLRPEGHSDIFSFDSLPPGNGSRTKKMEIHGL